MLALFQSGNNKILTSLENKKYLLGAGISFGMPAVFNYNFRFAINKINLEYAADLISNPSDGLNDDTGSILGQQYSIGINLKNNYYLNYIFGNTEYYGVEQYSKLYGANNNVYEYIGITLKNHQKYLRSQLLKNNYN